MTADAAGVIGVHHLPGRVVGKFLDSPLGAEDQALPALKAEPAAHAALRFGNELLLRDSQVRFEVEPFAAAVRNWY